MQSSIPRNIGDLLSYDYQAARRFTDYLAKWTAWRFNADGLCYHDAEDVAAETVSIVYRAAADERLPKGEHELKGYVYKTLRRRAVRALLRRKKHRTESLETLEDTNDEERSPFGQRNALVEQSVAQWSVAEQGDNAGERLDEILSQVCHRDRRFLEDRLSFHGQQPNSTLLKFGASIGMNANQARVKMCRIRKRVRCIKNCS